MKGRRIGPQSGLLDVFVKEDVFVIENGRTTGE